MYEELVELLRMRAALIDSDLDNQAAEAIEILEALAQNGQSAIDTNKRLADKIRMLKAKLDQAEGTLDFCSYGERKESNERRALFPAPPDHHKRRGIKKTKERP